jgi:hypothetical protein
VSVPRDEDATAIEIVPSAQQKRTLFQDIFGESAFTSSHPVPTGEVPRLQTGREARTVFDGPAYLMPPIETLVDPLVDALLRHRPEEDNSVSFQEVLDLGGEVSSDDDAEIDAGDAYEHGVIEARHVDHQEMRHITHIFKIHTKCSSLCRSL